MWLGGVGHDESFLRVNSLRESYDESMILAGPRRGGLCIAAEKTAGGEVGSGWSRTRCYFSCSKVSDAELMQ
jgi:hypothetical protein